MKKSWFPFKAIFLLTVLLTSCVELLPSVSLSNSTSTLTSQTTSIMTSLTTTSTVSSSNSTSTSSNSSSSSTISLPSSTTSSTSQSTNLSYTGYYAPLADVSDSNLMTTLRPIVRAALDSGNQLSVNYGDARDILPISDRDPNNSNNLILVYRQLSVKALWDGGTTWNREHVWPQSLMGVDTTNTSRHKGADLHNLKPANPSENSSRGNKYFAETTTTTSYAPPAVVRGDIARIMFYMVTMYPELSLIDITSGSPATLQMAQFSLFVKWHLEDPVDTFESNRNQVLYQYQGNRNPFIDHEELVCRMFRQQTTAATNYCAQA